MRPGAGHSPSPGQSAACRAALGNSLTAPHAPGSLPPPPPPKGKGLLM